VAVSDEVRPIGPRLQAADAIDGQFDRTPPQDIAAEQCVLGGMLLSKDAIADVVEIVRTVDFYKPAHALVFDTVLDLYGRGEPADAITVAAALTQAGELGRIGGAPYLHTLISSVPTAANASYYARIVAERAILRRLVEAGTRIVQLGYGSAAGTGRDVDDVVDLAQQAVYDVTERRVSEDFAMLGELLQPALDEIESIGANAGEMTGAPTGFTDLDRLLNGLHPGQLIVVAGRPGLGKALALDTPLAAPDGWTTMGEVRAGDQLIGADGRATTVVAATHVLHGRPCFEVEFSDGSVIVADAWHQWSTHTRTSRRYGREPEVRTTEEIAATLRTETADRRLNHSVTNARPLTLPARELLIPPYVLGVWLGDGHSAAPRFTTDDPEIVAYVEGEGFEVRPSGPKVYSILLPSPDPIPDRNCVVCGKQFTPKASNVRCCGQSCGGKARFMSDPVPAPTCPDCGGPTAGMGTGRRQCRSCWLRLGTVTGLLRTLGILDNKHIPAGYLRGSETQRRALLAGLLDTDGYAHKDGAVQFSVTNQRLAEDTYELVVSLGYRCQVTTKRVRGRTEKPSVAYTLTFTTQDDVFRLERKRIAHKERRRSTTTVRSGSRFIVDVRPIPSVPVRCVEVDNDDHLYLAGRSMIPTHNSTAALDFVRATSIRNSLASLVFSLEMSKVEIVMRLLSAESRVPLHVLRSGGLSDDDWTKLARRMGEISEAPMFVDDTPNMTLMEIRAKARRLKQRNDLKLIIVDYLQLMTSPKRVESRQQEVAELSRGLKLLAKEVECPVVAVSQLNRGPEQRTDKRPQLSDLRESGCLTAETRLLRADNGAEITLGELLATDGREIPVWALDESLRYVPRTLTHAFPSGVKETYKLRLASGRSVDATASHPFLTFSGWCGLGELVVGTRVAVARHVPAPLVTTAWLDEEVILLGHLIGDGSFVKRQPIRYASTDEENLAAVTAAAASRFGITAIRDDYAAARCTSLRLPAPYRLARGRRNPIAEWLDALGLFGLRSYEKFVPAAVFSLPKQQIALFLEHLWATDGCVWWDEKQQVARIYYASTSRRLVEDQAALLLRFGIHSRINEVRKSGYRPGYHLCIYDGDDQLRFLREIGVHGARATQVSRCRAELEQRRRQTKRDTVPVEVWQRVRSVLADRGMSYREFAAAMGTQFSGSTMWKRPPSRHRLARIAAVLEDVDLEILATNDVYWDKIVAIEPLGERPVYDATVLGLHNFVANGIAAHNSIEQDADVVILLHREDYYDKESPRAGEADFIVAKHRNGPTDTVTVAAQLHFSRFVDMAI